ncbi:hypothetical protein KV097_00765 [Mumia sp. zg.B17]|uniref:hypothetical protein n=1 Tax=Mumia sp. zg.B17 TaxID=2855446 RepID=UPI001C6E2458|nr:hypothetical protein [Mumia sp. zg.B17]MBW9204458.1 hypothetical protein [Mumia sp. zg.B17]
MIAHLPSALRRRVVLGVVAALLAGSGALAGAAVGIHHSVWMQVRAEALVGSEPHLVAHYRSEDRVRLQDGRVLPLWRTETTMEASPNDGDEVRVVRFPGDDQAFLVSEVSPADHPVVLRAIDWLWFLAFDGMRFFGFVLALAYGVVRLALGFTPMALPSLLRGRDGVDAVVVGWARLAKPDEVLVTVAVGDVTYQWTTRVGSDAPPRLGDTLRMVGRVRDGGWVLAWTDESRLLPTGPLHTPDAEVVRT